MTAPSDSLPSPLPAPGEDAPAASRCAPVPFWRTGVAGAFFVAAILLCTLLRTPTDESVAGVNMTLPYQMGDWWGTDQDVSLTEKTILPPDTEFARKTYESGSGNSVLCSIILSGTEKRSIHRPETCLPGQGWTIRNGQVIDVPLHSGHNLQVMNLTLSRNVTLSNGKKKEVFSYYIYWFVGDHIVTPYHWRRVWLSSWDRVVHHINHRWAYVIVNSMVTQGLRPNGKDPAETLAMLKKFIADIVPSIEKDEAGAVAPAPVATPAASAAETAPATP